MKPAFKFDDFGQIPTSKGKEFVPPRKQGSVKIAAVGNSDRSQPSEKVSEESLNGWVKKNINQFEQTEGRL